MRPISALERPRRRAVSGRRPTARSMPRDGQIAAAAAQPRQRPSPQRDQGREPPRSSSGAIGCVARPAAGRARRACTRRICAASWAREALAAKNSLTAGDAKLVEDAFEQRLSELSPTGARLRPRRTMMHRVADTRQAWPADRRGAPTAAERADPADDRHRQERARGRRAPPLSQPGAPSLRRPAALPALRPQAVRPASPALHAAAGARPQGQRRIRGPALPHPSSAGASRRQRGGLVAGRRHRSDQGRPQALEARRAWTKAGIGPDRTTQAADAASDKIALLDRLSRDRRHIVHDGRRHARRC